LFRPKIFALIEGIMLEDWKMLIGQTFMAHSALPKIFPQWIRDLASNDETVREQAYEAHLLIQLSSANRSYEVTPYVVPFLI